VGEPPFMLAISVYEAFKDAISAACPERESNVAVQLTAPATAENVLTALGLLQAAHIPLINQQ
jgi:xanthine dehydrogenase large subunit